MSSHSRGIQNVHGFLIAVALIGNTSTSTRQNDRLYRRSIRFSRCKFHPFPKDRKPNVNRAQSSFVSSFSLPPLSPQDHTKPSQTSQTDSTDVPQLIIPASENVNSDAPDPVVGHAEEGKEQAVADDPSAVTNPLASAEAAASSGEDWKETLDKNLEGWRAESAEARAKSESTRLRLEEEAAAARRRAEEEEKAERERLRREREDDEVERKVKELLREPKRKSAPHHPHAEGMDAKRWNAVRSAWEIVQGGKTVVPAQGKEGRSEFEEEEPVEVDGRDMTGGDHGGRDGNKAAEVLQVSRFSFPILRHDLS